MITLCRHVVLGLLLAASQLSLTSARNIFHFGDSYSWTSFNPDGPLPSKDNPIGNPAFPGETIFKGINFVGDFLKDHPTSGGSPTLFYNYAYPGAVVNNTLENGDNSRPDFPAQFGQFGKHKQFFKASEDVVSIYFGTNDINAWRDKPEMFHDIVHSFVNVMGELYEAGVRRFVVFGMDPLYRVPGYMTGPDSNLYTWFTAFRGVIDWNWQLREQLLGDFEDAHPDAKVVRFDTSPAFNKVLNDPESYGAPDNTCFNADGTSCLWLDGLHPTAAIHREIAKGYALELSTIDFF